MSPIGDNPFCDGVLQVPEEFSGPDFHGPRQPNQGLDGNGLFSTFNLANIFWVQVGALCKGFLCEGCGFPVAADAFPQCFTLLRDFRHACKQPDFGL